MNKPKREHNSELWLLALIAIGIILILGLVAIRAIDWDVAACLLVLQSIIGVIRDRPKERTTEKMTDQLAGSTPIDGAAKATEEKK